MSRVTGKERPAAVRRDGFLATVYRRYRCGIPSVVSASHKQVFNNISFFTIINAKTAAFWV